MKFKYKCNSHKREFTLPIKHYDNILLIFVRDKKISDQRRNPGRTIKPPNKEESLEEPLRDQAKPKSEPNVPNPKRRFPRRFSSRMKEVGPSVNSREEEQKGPGSFAGMENGSCMHNTVPFQQASKHFRERQYRPNRIAYPSFGSRAKTILQTQTTYLNCQNKTNLQKFKKKINYFPNLFAPGSKLTVLFCGWTASGIKMQQALEINSSQTSNRHKSVSRDMMYVTTFRSSRYVGFNLRMKSLFHVQDARIRNLCPKLAKIFFSFTVNAWLVKELIKRHQK
ncbi:hypothetical protein WN51_04489 [Melipona quadrifasciata]|uniref:Uncharacterized protein n=1 Tax=Melipona quadrifasciata TaxID=166423 RepID=A0A0N1IT60_9HYME|nr:hypothetical protein WN51_04489 [Melipona quadrifasciata]